MGWTVSGTGAVAKGVNVSQLIVPLPVGVQAGHLLLMQVYSRDVATRPIQIPNGWDLAQSRGAGGDHELLARVAGPNETAPAITFGGPGAAGVDQMARMIAFAGALQDIDQVAGVNSNNAWSSQNNLGPIPGVTPEHDHCLVVVGAAKQNDFGGPLTLLANDGLTWFTAWEESSVDGSDAGMVFAYAFASGRPAIGNKTFVDTGSNPGAGNGWMATFRPAPAAPPGPPASGARDATTIERIHMITVIS